MLKKLLFALTAAFAGMSFAMVPVDVNKADQAALDGIKGIGPSMSQKILDERKKGGDFKDWADLEQRVKGIKAKSAQRLSDAGLTINGKSLDGAAAAGKAEQKSSPAPAAKAAQPARNGSKDGSRKPSA